MASAYPSSLLSHYAERCRVIRELMQIHALAITTQLIQSGSWILRHLIYFCALTGNGNLGYARSLFLYHVADSSFSHIACDPFIWNTMIRGCTRSLQVEQALLFYREMLLRSIKPDPFTFPFVLNACAAFTKPDPGRQIHGQIVRLGFDPDVYVMNNLMQMYLNCQGTEVAMQVFDEISRPDIVSYNAIIHGCFLDGFVECARQLFEEMPEKNLTSWSIAMVGYERLGCYHEVLDLFSKFLLGGQPDAYILATAVSACANLCLLEYGKQIHSYVIKFQSFYVDVFLQNCVVHMYATCGSIDVARRIFDGIICQDVTTWNAMISGYARLGFLEEAWELLNRMPDKDVISWSALISGCLQSGWCSEGLLAFREMRTTGVSPNEVTLVTVLLICVRLMDILEGEKVHAYVIKCGLEDARLHNSLIHFYSSCRFMDKAWQLFERDKTEAAGWCAIITGFCRCGLVDRARSLFDSMPERDLVSWNSMISGYTQSGQLGEAFELFIEMQKSVCEPDETSLVSLISGCADLAALNQGMSLHGYMHRMGIEIDNNLGAALMDMYARCGSVITALDIFHLLKAKNISTWNVMIRGLAINGREKDALHMFKEMQLSEVAPDSITFLALLTACRHAGWLNLASLLFDRMRTIYGIEPTLAHYGCMVDILGHAGNLVEAEELIASMPMEPGIRACGALLLACKDHRNVEVGTRVVDRILQVDPGNTDCLLLLSNIYAEAGEWARAADIRDMMKEVRRSPRTPGLSSIDL